MEIELQPPQPDAVVRAVEELLAEAPVKPDPWWSEGLEEALRT